MRARAKWKCACPNVAKRRNCETFLARTGHTRWCALSRVCDVDRRVERTGSARESDEERVPLPIKLDAP